jgi:hypothetical protein
MKYLILIIPFIFSCANTKLRQTRTIAGSQPARIIKVINPNDSQFHIDLYPKVNIGLVTFKFGTSIASGRTANFKIVSGDGKLEKSVLISDKDGKVSNIYYPKSEGPVIIEIKVDRVTKIINFEVIRASKFSGTFSIKNTSFITDKNIVNSSGSEKLLFKVQVKDHLNKYIDAYGLDLKLIDGSQSIPMKESGEGLYTLNYTVSKVLKDTEFSFSINDQVSDQKIHIQVNPVPYFSSTSLSFNTLDDGKIQISFPLKSTGGEIIKDLSRIRIYAISSESTGQFSKINFDPTNNKYFYIFTPKKGAGLIKLGVDLNGEKYFSQNDISYKYNPDFINSLQVDLENRKIIPTGMDHLNLKIIPFTKDKKVIKLTKLSKNIEVDIIGCAKIYDLAPDKEMGINARIVPDFGCSKIELFVKLKGKVIFDKIINFSFEPINEKIILKRSIPTTGWSKSFTYQYTDGRGYKPTTGKTEAIKFTNDGGNEVIPTGCAKDADDNNCQASRGFDFGYLDQARQNIELTVTDVPTDFTSHMMGSVFYFFPRIVLPHATLSSDKSQIIVTLPTNEKVYFDSKTKEIVGGVLEEGPIDLGPVRFHRKFPNIRYKGYGVVLRINARGSEPRFGQFNNTRISGDFGDTGGKDVLIYKYDKNTDQINTCYGKKTDFWPQKDTSPIPFIMYSDEKFQEYLNKNCSFSF